MEVDQAQSVLNIDYDWSGPALDRRYVVSSPAIRPASGKRLRTRPEPQPMLVHDTTVAQSGRRKRRYRRERRKRIRRSPSGPWPRALGTSSAVSALWRRRRATSVLSRPRAVRGIPAHGLGTGEMWFSMQTSQNTHVEYAVEVATGTVLITLARVMNVVSLVAVTIGYFAISKWVIPDPLNRTQVFQMLQTIHFLWPPFLFAGLYRYQYAAVAGEVETFVHNIPYLRKKGDGGH